MEAAFIQKMKELLLSMKQEIVDKLIASDEEFRSLFEELEPRDQADEASDDTDRRMLDVLGVQDMKRLKAIDNALIRIEQNRYGLCVKCGKKIPHERLEALPYAVLCIECQRVDERKNR